MLWRNFFFTPVLIMKNHFATGGYWKQFGRTCLLPDNPLSISNEMQEREN